MNRNSRHLLSICTIVLFAVLAIASAKINKIHCGAFNYHNIRENTGDRAFVELRDGRKIYGDDISWKTGLLVKDMIKVDGEKFPIKETRGYYSKGFYYGQYGTGYAKRIISGKLNVYYKEDWVTVTSTNARTGLTSSRERLVCTHYVQRGDTGELEAIASQRDILKYVGDCPRSVEMIDRKDRDIRRAIKKNGNYLNDIFYTYNNGCR